MQSKTQKPIHIQRTSDKRVQQPNKFFVNKNDNTPIIGPLLIFSRNQITPRRKMTYVSRKTQTCLQCGEDNTRKLRLLRWPFRNPDTVALCSKTPSTLVACFTVNKDVPAKEPSNSPLPPASRKPHSYGKVKITPLRTKAAIKNLKYDFLRSTLSSSRCRSL